VIVVRIGQVADLGRAADASAGRVEADPEDVVVERRCRDRWSLPNRQESAGAIERNDAVLAAVVIRAYEPFDDTGGRISRCGRRTDLGPQRIGVSEGNCE